MSSVAVAGEVRSDVSGDAEVSSTVGLSTVVDRLLKEPEGLLAGDLDELALSRRLISVAAFGAATFGAAVGMYRGGVQALFAAIKLPAVVLLTCVLIAAALVGAEAALGRERKARTQLLLVLIAAARGAAVLSATAPVVLLAACLRMDYHRATMLVVACCGIAGLVGLGPMVKVLFRDRARRFALTAVLLFVTILGGTHLTWLGRPYLVRPRETSVPFLRAIEGGFWHSLQASSRSARGIYESGCESCTPGETP